MQYVANMPLKKIVSGKNPRTFFCPTKLEELCSTIKAHGVIQPILVKPIGSIANPHYQIIAGERRWRASIMAFGVDSGSIPVLIKEKDSEEESRRIALIENIQREQMSPTEESDAALQILNDVKGNKAEAMRLLGWKPSLFDARMALQHLEPVVKVALNERRILLGHAELIAVIARTNQEIALRNVIENKLTVQQTKELLTRVSQKLQTAIFDKSDCQSCVSNSEVQATLLENCVGEGYCTNRECFTAKTEQKIQEIASGLKDELPKVEIVRELHSIKVVSVNEQSVGSNQFNSCKGCANYGATVSALADSVGLVSKNQCFDTQCNSEMVTNHALEIAKKAQANTQSESESEGNSVESLSQAKTTASAKPTSPAIKKIKVTETTARKTNNVRADEFKQKTWRKVVANELFADTHKASTILLSLMYTGSMRHYQSSNVKKLSTKLFGFDRGNDEIKDITLSDFTTLPKEQRESGTNAAIASLMLTIPISEVFEIAQFYQFDLMKHWKITKEYLELFTKSELESMCNETGLDTFFESQSAFKKALSGKKPEFIDSILSVTVDWDTVVPSAIALPHTSVLQQRKLPKQDATTVPACAESAEKQES